MEEDPVPLDDPRWDESVMSRDAKRYIQEREQME